MTDCLIIGFNDTDFAEQVSLLRSMGARSGAYRDLDLAFVEIDGCPMRCLDVLNDACATADGSARRHLHNADFLWPVILYLHTYLTRRGFASDFVNLFHLERERLRAKLSEGTVRTVAITTTLYVSPHPILEIVGFVRSIDPSIGIIVGGPYIHNQAQLLGGEALLQLMGYLGADYYVISREGEATLAALLAALKASGSLTDVANLGYRRDGRFTVNALVTETNPLEQNMIDYDLFSPETLSRFVSVRTAKSCPFHCAFCGFPQRAGEYQYLTLDLVEQELDQLAARGITMVTFLDDTFNVPKKRYKQILRLMIAKQYPFRWNSFYRCDHGDDETIDLMGQAGCEGVFIGAESGSDFMLERMNKTVRRKHLLGAIPRLQANGISCHANLIVGFPGETNDTVDDTIDLIERARPDYFRAQLWYADPMTPIWKRRNEFGIRGEAFSWSHNTMDAETACDLIDRMFLSVEHSTWLPQHGFEQWSTFYLQRHGMTREQIRTLVRCFNAAIKDKLLRGNCRGVAPDLLESLRAAARRDVATQSEGTARSHSVAALDGSRYKSAEAYWTEEFRASPAAPALADLGAVRTGAACWQTRPSAVGSSPLSTLCRRLDAAPEVVLAAGLAMLVLRVSGSSDIPFLVGVDGLLLPLRLRLAWWDRFDHVAQMVAEKLTAAREHGRYALSILDNPVRLRRHRMSPPRFGAALVVDGIRHDALPAILATGGWSLLSDMALIACARSGEAGDGIEVDFVYDLARFDADLVAGLDQVWTHGLVQAAADPDSTVGGETARDTAERNSPRVEDDSRAVFAF
jgi:radical SAM PhpK family P-methyltransferase